MFFWFGSGVLSGHPGTNADTYPLKYLIFISAFFSACKGRRYQEFKDAVGRRGRRPCGKSDGESSQHSEDEHIATVSASSIKTATTTAMSFSMATTPSGEGSNLARNETKSRLTNGSPPFDLEKELQAIPALRPEEFQRRIQANKVQQPRLSSPAGQTDLHMSAVATAKKTKAQKQNPSTATPQAHHQQQLHQPQQVHQQGHASAAAPVAASKSHWDSSQRH